MESHQPASAPTPAQVIKTILKDLNSWNNYAKIYVESIDDLLSSSKRTGKLNGAVYLELFNVATGSSEDFRSTLDGGDPRDLPEGIAQDLKTEKITLAKSGANKDRDFLVVLDRDVYPHGSKTAPPSLGYFLKSAASPGGSTVRCVTPSDGWIPFLDQAFADYYKDTSQSPLSAIAKLVRRLQIMSCFPGCNDEVNIGILLPYLLLKNGRSVPNELNELVDFPEKLSGQADIKALETWIGSLPTRTFQ